jgi:parallel beta-helix repeat protein
MLFSGSEVHAQTAQTIYVNAATGNDAASAGIESAPYRTISYALQQANTGTTIRVASGTYSVETGERFPLQLKPGVNLQGNDTSKGQDILIRGGGGYLSPTFARQNTTIVAQKGSIIQGLTITNPNTRGTGIWIETGNPTIANNTFTNNLREGVFVSGNATPRITNNVFSRNSASGLSIARDAQGEVSNNLFDSTGFGIQISDNSTPMLANNQVTRNQDGIVISHSSRPILRNNRVEENVRYGIVIVSEARPDFGSISNPGSNSVKSNGQFDLYNLNSNLSIALDGNQIGTIGTGTPEPMQVVAEEPQPEVNAATPAKKPVAAAQAPQRKPARR